MKVLLIGGTGVLSSEVLKQCVTNNFETYIINRGNRKYLIPEKVKLLKADINDDKKIINLIDGVYFDVVIDFLCYTEKQIEHSISLFNKSCQQFIFISSAIVYKETKGIIIEDFPLINPKWNYSINKVACERKLISLCKEYNINYTIIRPGVTYGNTRIPYGFMPTYGFHWTLVARMLNNKPIITWNGGNNISAITHVEDFTVGLIGLIGNKLAYNEAYHIVGDEYYKWIDVINILEKILKKKAIIIDIPKEFLAEEFPCRKGEILGGRSVDLKFNNSKLKKIVPNFTNTISLAEGIQKTIVYYKQNNYLNGIDYSFDGNIDRIIKKYITSNKKLIKTTYNTSYIDYLDEKKIRNKIIYLIAKFKDLYLVKVPLVLIKKL